MKISGLTNKLQFPNTPAKLNGSHPALVGHSGRLAVVPQNAGFFDLISGVFNNQTNSQGTAVLSATNQPLMGRATTIPSPRIAATANVFFPALVSESFTTWTIAGIFQPLKFTTGDGNGFINLCSSGGAGAPALKWNSNNGSLNFVGSGVGVGTAAPIVLGHTYFCCASRIGSTVTVIVKDLNTGQIWVTSGTNGTTLTPVAYGLMTYDVTPAGADAFALGAAFIGVRPLNINQMIEWSENPWSLWYDQSALSVLQLAQVHVTRNDEFTLFVNDILETPSFSMTVGHSLQLVMNDIIEVPSFSLTSGGGRFIFANGALWNGSIPESVGSTQTFIIPVNNPFVIKDLVFQPVGPPVIQAYPSQAYMLYVFEGATGLKNVTADDLGLEAASTPFFPTTEYLANKLLFFITT